MPALHLFFSHRLTPEQEQDAKESLKVDRFIYLPEDLQQLFSNIPPHLEDLSEYVRPFVQYLLQNAKVGDFVLIQGDFGLCYKLVQASFTLGLIPIYATTQRQTIERVENGEVIKVSTFRHIRFRRY